MAEAVAEETDAPKKKGLLFPLLIGFVLAGVGGAGSFFAINSGLILGGDETASDSHGGSEHSDGEHAEEDHTSRPDLADVAFVALEPIVVSLGSGENGRHLLFSAELEVAPDDADAVEHLMPRVMDVLNSYLRVIEMDELHDPRTLVRLRAQLLRRVQIVTGDALVRDLLVTEFVVN